MKYSGLANAVLTCLRDKQFWREAARETVYLVTGSSNGLAMSLTAAVLGIAHRLFEHGLHHDAAARAGSTYRAQRTDLLA